MRVSLLLGSFVSITLLASISFAEDPHPPPPDAVSEAPAAPPAATPVAAPAPVLAPVASAPAVPVLRVHITSRVSASLEHRATPSSPWESVCSTPCDIQAVPAEEYRVLGNDVAPSPPFVFDGSRGDKVDVQVIAGRPRKARIGLFLLGGGGILAIAGIATFIGASTMSAYGSDGTLQQGFVDALFAGGALVTGGIGLAAWGAGYWATNRASSVSGAVLEPRSRPSEPLPVPKAAFTFPILQLTF